ncbi:MAG: alpha/beta hydrolase [Clostridia bacterium]|nr:alpha/beta hydrolase [Clostridia bacterium]
MGGYTAFAIAQKYPESVKNLLLYSTAGNNGLFDLLDPLTTNPVTAKTVGSLIEAIGKNPFFVKLIMSWATQDKAYLEGYDYEALMAPYRIEGTGEGIVYSLSTHTKTDYDAVAKMPPMLFLNGSRDTVCPLAERINLRSALPEGSVDFIMEGAGHMLIESRAAEVASVTLDFLSENP